jgi:hypothetical protein
MSFDVDDHGPFCPQCGAKAPDSVDANKGPKSIGDSGGSGDTSGSKGDADTDTPPVGDDEFRCPSCDEVLNESVSFCSSCGEDVTAYPKQDDADESPTGDVDTCPDCGAQLSGGEAFCPDCGAAIPDDSDGDDSAWTVELIVGNDTVEVQDGDVRGGEWRQKLYEAGLDKNDARRVSRTHLEFEGRDDGLYVTDANSSNGTEYNGQELSPGEYRKLEDGDELTLAGVADITVRVS